MKKRFWSKKVSLFLVFAMTLAMIPAFGVPSLASEYVDLAIDEFDEEPAPQEVILSDGGDQDIEDMIAGNQLELARLVEFAQISQSIGGGYGSNGKFMAPIEAPAADSIPVSTRAELEAIRNNLRGKYHLTQDIDLSGAEWIPIGDNSSNTSSFRGVFDGQGHVIRNLTITGDYAYAGLFGYVNNAIIKNIGMETLFIDIDVSSREVYTGGIIGYALLSLVSNCYNTGSVSASSSHSSYVGGLIGDFYGPRSSSPSSPLVINCYNTGTVVSISSYYSHAGGIIGFFTADSSLVSNCYNTGSVSASSSSSSSSSYSYAGGLIGSFYSSDSSVRNCYNTGSISASSAVSYAGGLIGNFYSTNCSVRNCYNTGSVSTSSHYSSDSSNTGGIISYFDSFFSDYYSSVNNCYWMFESDQIINDVYRSETDKLGVGNMLNDITGRLTSAQMKDRANFIDWDFDEVWDISPSVNDGYPFLRNIPNGDVPSSPTPTPTSSPTPTPTITPTPTPPSAPSGPYPVIIVPGIAGSELFEGGDLIWGGSSETQVGLNALTNGMHRIALDSEGAQPPSLSVQPASGGYGTMNIYRDLYIGIDYSSAGTTTHFFSYDWRLSNVDNAQKLALFIDEVLATESASKVNIVAHSMGNLVTSRYISDGHEQKINKYIAIAPPFLGSPKVPYVWATGDLLGKWMANLSGVPANFKLLSSHFPSVYELLPPEWDIFADYFGFGAAQHSRFISVKSGFPALITSEEDPYAYIADPMDLRTYNPPNPAPMSAKVSPAAKQSFLQRASEFHRSLFDTNGHMTNRVDTYVLYGNGVSTISNVVFNSNGGYVEKVEFIGGDGTVPMWSATLAGTAPRMIGFSGGEHTALVSNKKCIEAVIDILGGGDGSNTGTSPTNTYHNVITVECPVDIEITHNGESLSSVEGNFNAATSWGALYLIGENNDVKVVALDLGINLSVDVKLTGTDDGFMTYSVEYFDSDFAPTTSYSIDDVPLSATTVITTNTDASQGLTLNIDEDGDGVIDSVLPMNQEMIGTGSYTILTTARSGGSVSGGGVYEAGESVTLTATPDDEFTFEGWYENGMKVSGAEATYTFVAISDRTLEARFGGEIVIPAPVYTIAVEALEGGDAIIDHSVSAPMITVMATPYNGYTFEGWYEQGVKITGAEATYTFTVTADRTLEARFVPLQTTYTIVATAGSGGSVSGGGTYEAGENVILRATPNSGYTFEGWYEAGEKVSGALATYTFIVTGDRTLEARFTVGSGQSPSFPIPEKVMLNQTSRGPLVFNYSSVLPGGRNRPAFLDTFSDLQAPGQLLILGGGVWYDVNNITFIEAFNQKKTVSAVSGYYFITNDGQEVSEIAALLIDDITQSYPLTIQSVVQSLYQRYQALSASEKTAIATDSTIIDLLEAYNSFNH